MYSALQKQITQEEMLNCVFENLITFLRLITHLLFDVNRPKTLGDQIVLDNDKSSFLCKKKQDIKFKNKFKQKREIHKELYWFVINLRLLSVPGGYQGFTNL